MKAGYDAFFLSAALPLMTRANPTLLQSGTYYLSETQDGTIIGCGGWTFERPGGGEVVPGLVHIRHFATHPDWIGRGIGTALVRAM
jgi:GNAT superfamily N-acetyltransferase